MSCRRCESHGKSECDCSDSYKCESSSECSKNLSSRDSRSYRGGKRYDSGVYRFCSLISPISELLPLCSKGSLVEFEMRRKNKTVTLQWESFTGKIDKNGVNSVSALQSISNLPPYKMYFSYLVRVRDKTKLSVIEINPFSRDCIGNIIFYLNENRSGHGIECNDHIEIFSGSVTWIVD